MNTLHQGLFVLLLSGTAAAQSTPSQTAQLISEGRKHFEVRCGGCHGGEGRGGERGPDIVTTRSARRRNAEQVRKLVREGIPDAGMPGFDLPDIELTPLVTFYRSLTASASETTPPGDAAAGEQLFFGKANCHTCHVRGHGGIVGPDLSSVGSRSTLAELQSALKEPTADVADGYQQVEVKLTDGELIRGFARNESGFDLQLQTVDGGLRSIVTGRIAEQTRKPGSLMPRFTGSDVELENLVAFLSRLDGSASSPLRKRESAAAAVLPGAVSFESIVHPGEGDWPTYNGRLHGNRHSALDEIKTWNVGKLRAEWMFPIRAPRSLEVTPVVVNGVMYVTTVNAAFALDAATGRQIWAYDRPRTEGVIGDAGSGINRGVAILGDRVFMVTDNAHLIALDRLTGRLLWDTKMADSYDHYGSTLAPLIVKDLVIAGVGGGDEGIRGFLAAYKAVSGEEAWRFWTVPLPGEPLSETWVGSVLPHGCAATWLTGTYDPELDLLYWPTGNPCPDMNGDERQGDNLYSASVLAIEPDTGKLSWYYQYTPHDLNDWDANQTPLLIDAEFRGRPRKLLVQANRNGFFYVLDRTNGEVLLAKPFVEKVNWASEIGPDGRPRRIEGAVPTPGGTKICPSMAGATNWMSSAYSPQTGLVYVQTTEQCNIYTKRPEEWQRGQSFYAGGSRSVPEEPGVRHLRALRLETGEIAWNRRQTGPNRTWGGVLSTDGGVVFYGDDSGAFVAVDAADGKALWHFHANEAWKASPMTYLAGGKQFVAVASGNDVIAFALPEEE
jgi:PQQ-dependent dehydrogenase (methanol/ethanol family)